MNVEHIKERLALVNGPRGWDYEHLRYDMARVDMPEMLTEIERLTTERDALLAALEQAQEDVCSLRCPSVWKTGEPQPHSERCQAISALLSTARRDGQEGAE